MLKKCKECKIDIDIELYHNDKRSHDGKQRNCAACTNKINTKWRETHRKDHRAMNKAYYANNVEKITKYQAEHRLKNLEDLRLKAKLRAREARKFLSTEKRTEINEKKKVYRLANIEKVNAYKRKYEKEKPQIRRCGAMKRKAAKKQRMPIWADSKKINAIYRDCPKDMVVDHVIPLNGKEVSGLHVHYNLQYLTPEENGRKSNKLCL